MWFRFPPGAERIAIERQEFASEFVDENGRHYFRVPAHFAPRVLALGAGFESVVNLPEGIPEDLPREDPGRDEAIASLTASLVASQDEVGNMRSSLLAMQRDFAALQAENVNLKSDLARVNARIADLQDDIEDQGRELPAAPHEKVATNGAKRA